MNQGEEVIGFVAGVVFMILFTVFTWGEPVNVFEVQDALALCADNDGLLTVAAGPLSFKAVCVNGATFEARS